MDAVSALGPSSAVAPQASPWHTPIPYLFGGLAAMMGLIAFALIVLACSYWKLSGNSDHDDEVEADVESGNVNPENDNNRPPEMSSDTHDKCLVIMAGEAKPTFLATPSSSRTTSFGSSSWRSNLTAITASSSTSEMEMMEEMK